MRLEDKYYMVFGILLLMMNAAMGQIAPGTFDIPWIISTDYLQNNDGNGLIQYGAYCHLEGTIRFSLVDDSTCSGPGSAYDTYRYNVDLTSTCNSTNVLTLSNNSNTMVMPYMTHHSATTQGAYSHLTPGTEYYTDTMAKVLCSSKRTCRLIMNDSTPSTNRNRVCVNPTLWNTATVEEKDLKISMRDDQGNWALPIDPLSILGYPMLNETTFLPGVNAPAVNINYFLSSMNENYVNMNESTWDSLVNFSKTLDIKLLNYPSYVNPEEGDLRMFKCLDSKNYMDDYPDYDKYTIERTNCESLMGFNHLDENGELEATVRASCPQPQMVFRYVGEDAQGRLFEKYITTWVDLSGSTNDPVPVNLLWGDPISEDATICFIFKESTPPYDDMANVTVYDKIGESGIFSYGLMNYPGACVGGPVGDAYWIKGVKPNYLDGIGNFVFKTGVFDYDIPMQRIYNRSDATGNYNASFTIKETNGTAIYGVPCKLQCCLEDYCYMSGQFAEWSDIGGNLSFENIIGGSACNLKCTLYGYNQLNKPFNVVDANYYKSYTMGRDATYDDYYDFKVIVLEDTMPHMPIYKASVKVGGCNQKEISPANPVYYTDATGTVVYQNAVQGCTYHVEAYKLGYGYDSGDIKTGIDYIALQLEKDAEQIASIEITALNGTTTITFAQFYVYEKGAQIYQDVSHANGLFTFNGKPNTKYSVKGVWGGKTIMRDYMTGENNNVLTDSFDFGSSNDIIEERAGELKNIVFNVIWPIFTLIIFFFGLSLFLRSAEDLGGR